MPLQHKLRARHLRTLDAHSPAHLGVEALRRCEELRRGWGYLREQVNLVIGLGRRTPLWGLLNRGIHEVDTRALKRRCGLRPGRRFTLLLLADGSKRVTNTRRAF